MAAYTELASHDVLEPLSQKGGKNQDKVTVVFTFTGDTSHTATGEGLTLQLLGLATCDVIVFEDLYLSDTTYQTLKYDRGNEEVLIYDVDIAGASGDEITVASGNLSANTYRGYAIGTANDWNA